MNVITIFQKGKVLILFTETFRNMAHICKLQRWLGQRRWKYKGVFFGPHHFQNIAWVTLGTRKTKLFLKEIGNGPLSFTQRKKIYLQNVRRTEKVRCELKIMKIYFRRIKSNCCVTVYTKCRSVKIKCNCLYKIIFHLAVGLFTTVEFSTEAVHSVED